MKKPSTIKNLFHFLLFLRETNLQNIDEMKRDVEKMTQTVDEIEVEHKHKVMLEWFVLYIKRNVSFTRSKLS